MLGWLARWLGLGNPATGRGLREQARDPEPDQRRRAAESLGAVAEPWACDVLLRLVQDAIPEVRDAARAALHRQGAAAVGALVKLLDHADPKMAVPAAEMLGQLKAPEAVRPLLLVMKFGALDTRAAAIRALVRYGAAAVPALEVATQDPDPWTRMRSEEILADIRAALPAPAPPAPAPETAQPERVEAGSAAVAPEAPERPKPGPNAP
jgi:HEAT repeat protein